MRLDCWHVCVYAVLFSTSTMMVTYIHTLHGDFCWFPFFCLDAMYCSSSSIYIACVCRVLFLPKRLCIYIYVLFILVLHRTFLKNRHGHWICVLDANGYYVDKMRNHTRAPIWHDMYVCTKKKTWERRKKKQWESTNYKSNPPLITSTHSAYSSVKLCTMLCAYLAPGRFARTSS